MLEYATVGNINGNRAIALKSFSIRDLSIYVQLDMSSDGPFALQAKIRHGQNDAYRIMENRSARGFTITTIEAPADVETIRTKLPVIAGLFDLDFTKMPQYLDNPVEFDKNMDELVHALTAMVVFDGPATLSYKNYDRGHDYNRKVFLKIRGEQKQPLYERSEAEIFAPIDSNITTDWGDWA